MTNWRSLVAAVIVLRCVAAVGANEPISEPFEPDALELAQFSLDAAHMNRVALVMIAESSGEDARNALERAKEERAVGILTQTEETEERTQLVSSQIAGVLRQLQFLQAQRKLAEDDPVANGLRLKKLASIKEIQEYRNAAKRLSEVAAKRQEEIDKAKANGNDVRTRLEASVEQFSLALEANSEYKAAIARLKEEEAEHAGADYLTGLFSHTPCLALRVAVLRYQVNKRASWP